MTKQLKIKILSAAFLGCVAVALTLTGCDTPSRDVPAGAAITSGGSTGYIGQTLTLGTWVPGSATCLPGYCTFLNFNNAPSSGFLIPCSPAFITVKVNGVVYSTANYEVRWRYGAGPGQSGCATTFSGTQKQYASAANKRYTYTVYFRTPCPAVGSTVEIIIECQGGGAASQSLKMTK